MSKANELQCEIAPIVAERLPQTSNRKRLAWRPGDEPFGQINSQAAEVADPDRCKVAPQGWTSGSAISRILSSMTHFQDFARRRLNLRLEGITP